MPDWIYAHLRYDDLILPLTLHNLRAQRAASLKTFTTLFNTVFDNTLCHVREQLFPHGPSGPNRHARIIKACNAGGADSQTSEREMPWTQNYLDTVIEDAKMMLDLTPGKKELQVPFDQLETTLQCAKESATGEIIDDKQSDKCGGAIASFRVYIEHPAWDFAKLVEDLDDNLAPSTRDEVQSALESLKTYLRSFRPDVAWSESCGTRFPQSKQSEAAECRTLMHEFEVCLPAVDRMLEAHLANQQKLDQARKEITRAFASGQLSSILRSCDQNSQSSASCE